jgi:hypothetical protein
VIYLDANVVIRLEAGVAVFLTGDRGLAKCSEVPVEIL